MKNTNTRINALALSYIVGAGGGAVLRFNKTSKYYEDHDIHLHQIGIMDRYKSLEDSPSPIHRLIQILRSIIFLTNRGWKYVCQSKVDLIITPIGGLTRCLISAFIIHLTKRIPWVIIVQGSMGGYFGNSYNEIYKLYREAGHSIFDAIMMELHCLISRSFGWLMLQSGNAIITVEEGLIPPGTNVPIFRIPNTYEPKKPPSRDEIRQNDLDAVFLGRVIPEKGIYDLIDAWSMVTNSISNARLGVIGPIEKGIEPIIRRRIISLELEDNVTIFGGRFGQEKESLLKKSKLFVTASRSESFGFVIFEALNYGLPVICYELEPLKRNLSNCEAIIYTKYGDKYGLAYNIIKMLQNSDKIKLLSSKAIDYIKQCSFPSWKDIAKNEIKVYFSVLKVCL